MKFIKSEIIGLGGFVPAKTLTNDDLAQMVETSDEWIVERTGIKSRHIASESEYTSDLAFAAASEALKESGTSAEEIDLLILATITPDNTTPSTACKVANMLGMRKGAAAFDISAACSGFVYALTVADSMIKNRLAKKALVIGAETISKITDWTDRNTCVLFGDGAGAAVLQAVETDDENASGIISSQIFAGGQDYEYLLTSGGVSTTQKAGYIMMNGKEVFKNAVVCLAEGAEEVLKKAGMTTDDVDWFIPHQANIRIIEATAKRLKVDENKVVVSLENKGNTSAASIPLAFAENVKSKKIKKGNIVLLTSMGAGFVWGAVLLKF